MWSGRGEAAGDRAATTELSRASTVVDRGHARRAGYGSYARIGATSSDPVRRGGTGQDTLGKRSGMERRRGCHIRESLLPLAEGGIEAVAALPYRGGSGDKKRPAEHARPPPTAETGPPAHKDRPWAPERYAWLRRGGAAGMEHARKITAREDCDDLRHQQPHGRL